MQKRHQPKSLEEAAGHGLGKGWPGVSIDSRGSGSDFDIGLTGFYSTSLAELRSNDFESVSFKADQMHSTLPQIL